MSNDVMTVVEVAEDLRCSKAHVYKILLGKVPGLPALAALSLGRRRLVRRRTLEAWKRATERVADAMISPSPKI